MQFADFLIKVCENMMIVIKITFNLLQLILQAVISSMLYLQQTHVGFDLLRSNGRSYVCDVNGCAFMKSEKCFDDCSQILL